jgi:hypothetical protein
MLVAGDDVLLVTDDRGSKLEVVALSDGRIVKEVPIPITPAYIYAKGDRVELVGATARVEITTRGTIAPPLPELDVEKGAKEKEDDTALACVLLRALEALDRRSSTDTLTELNAATSPNLPPVVALRTAAEFLERAKEKPGSVVDLTDKLPTRILPSVTSPASTAEGASADAPQVRLVKKPGAPKGAGRPSMPPFDAPAAVGIKFPDEYGGETLYRSIYFREANVLVYGERYIAILDGMRTRSIFDVEPLVHLGKIGRAELVIGTIEMRGNVLYVGVGSPDSREHDDEGIYAIDGVTGSTLWASAPGVLGPHFVRFGDYFVGTTRKKGDAFDLAVVFADTGAIMSTGPSLSSVPLSVGRHGAQVLVELPNDFDLFDVGK